MSVLCIKMSSWMTAIKKYAEQNGKYVVPRKGSPEYDAVRKIQSELEGPKAPVVVAKAPEPVGVVRPKPKKSDIELDVEAKEVEHKKARAKDAKIKADTDKISADNDAAEEARIRAQIKALEDSLKKPTHAGTPVSNNGAAIQKQLKNVPIKKVKLGDVVSVEIP